MFEACEQVDKLMVVKVLMRVCTTRINILVLTKLKNMYIETPAKMGITADHETMRSRASSEFNL